VNRVSFRTASAPALVIATLAAAATPSGAVVTVDLPNPCSDRNTLQAIAPDAQLNAIKLYYKGFIRSSGNADRQACLEAHVLMDDQFAVINTTRDLVVSKCLAIDVAAQMATEGVCP